MRKTREMMRKAREKLKKTGSKIREKLPARKIKIYHSLREGVKVEDIIKSGGLKSMNQLIKEGKAEPRYKALPDQNENIYFRYYSKEKAKQEKEGSGKAIAIKVNPKKVIVHNQELRVKPMGKGRGLSWEEEKKLKRGQYNASGMPLEEYLEKKRRGEEMQKNRPPGTFVIYHPITAEPELVGVENINKYGIPGGYIHEVTIKKDVIPPKKFADYSNKKEIKRKMRKERAKGLTQKILRLFKIR